MLSDRNIRKINDQIESELRTVDSWSSSDGDKSAALDRITKLKNLLSPQPSRGDILSELADAIVAARTTESTTTSPLADLGVELAAMLRRR